ncbi:hypothetical protein J2Y69_002687 [Microbacterium resistens]|uniref:Tat pathway signal sequence domain protein n=1 Tax=Microbacterium resistens TaxID=156977 RepID=A0ABU1SEN8_9MICO|nr:hypothetical protein [Microbacterium resistens]MDR6868076.1 hypothetical protein [Microbacterium resistens]
MTDQQIPRRAVVKAAAWATPVIALAAAVPSAAASGGFACPSDVRPAAVVTQLDPSDWHVFLARAWWSLSSKYFGIDTTLVDPAVYGSTYEFTLLGGTRFTMSDGGGSTAPWYPSFSTFVGTVGTVTPLPPVAGTIGELNALVVPDVYDPNANVDVIFEAADAFTPSSVQFTAELRFTSPTTGETVVCVQDFTYVIASSFTGGPVINGHGHLNLTGTVGV